MQYLDQERKVIYTAKDKKDKQGFPRPGMDGRDVFTHPERGWQMVRYFNSYTPTMKKEVLINYLPLR